MQQQIQRPIRRTEPQWPNDDKQEVWPLSARQFMKLPVSGLLSAGKRLTFTRLSAPTDQAALIKVFLGKAAREVNGMKDLGRRRVIVYWSWVFLGLALVAALLGLSGLAATATGLSDVLFLLFFVAYLVSLFIGGRAAGCLIA